MKVGHRQAFIANKTPVSDLAGVLCLGASATRLGAWSPIHILSLITLVLLVRAYWAIRRGKLLQHADLMKSAFYNALLLAIFFTVLPGRIMHDVVFGVSTADASQQAVSLWAWILMRSF